MTSTIKNLKTTLRLVQRIKDIYWLIIVIPIILIVEIVLWKENKNEKGVYIGYGDY